MITALMPNGKFNQMAYFVVKLREDDSWVVVPRRWMSQSHRMFFRPDCEDWKEVDVLAGRHDDDDNYANWKRCLIHDDITTAENFTDGCRKRNEKNARQQPLNLPGPAVDTPDTEDDAAVMNAVPVSNAQLIEQLKDHIGPLKSPEDLRDLDLRLEDNDSEFYSDFRRLLGQIVGQDAEDTAQKRLGAIIRRELAVQLNYYRTTNRKVSIWNQRHLMNVYIELYCADTGDDTDAAKRFRAVLQKWHKAITKA